MSAEYPPFLLMSTEACCSRKSQMRRAKSADTECDGKEKPRCSKSEEQRGILVIEVSTTFAGRCTSLGATPDEEQNDQYGNRHSQEPENCPTHFSAARSFHVIFLVLQKDLLEKLIRELRSYEISTTQSVRQIWGRACFRHSGVEVSQLRGGRQESQLRGVVSNLASWKLCVQTPVISRCFRRLERRAAASFLSVPPSAAAAKSFEGRKHAL